MSRLTTMRFSVTHRCRQDPMRFALLTSTLAATALIAGAVSLPIAAPASATDAPSFPIIPSPTVSAPASQLPTGSFDPDRDGVVSPAPAAPAPALPAPSSVRFDQASSKVVSRAEDSTVYEDKNGLKKAVLS